MLRSGSKLRGIGLGVGLGLSLCAQSFCFADDAVPSQPYIDQIKLEMEPKPPSSFSGASYTEEVKKKLESENPALKGADESYIDYLREQNPSLRSKSSEETYLEAEKAKLKPKNEIGAIQAVQEGKSGLQLKKPGAISQAFGLRYGVSSIDRKLSYSGSSDHIDFKSLYGKNYAPEFSFLYEYQLGHSETFGSLGLIGILGVGIFSGTGQLSIQLEDPRSPGTYFSTQSQTTFQLFSFPATVGLSYRFNLFHFLRPYLMVGPTATGFWEIRSDSKPNDLALSYSAYASVGVAILLDWMSQATNWGLFSEHGIHHSYLTVDYIQIIPIGGKVRVQSTGVFAGFTFEY